MSHSVVVPIVQHLADAWVRGAMPQLEFLFLAANTIGDDGAKALADALAGGALTKLTTLWMGHGPLGVHHPQLKAACQKRGVCCS